MSVIVCLQYVSKAPTHSLASLLTSETGTATKPGACAHGGRVRSTDCRGLARPEPVWYLGRLCGDQHNAEFREKLERWQRFGVRFDSVLKCRRKLVQ